MANPAQASARFPGGVYGEHTFRAYDIPEGARGIIRVLCDCGQRNLNLRYHAGQPVEVLT